MANASSVGSLVHRIYSGARGGGGGALDALEQTTQLCAIFVYFGFGSSFMWVRGEAGYEYVEQYRRDVVLRGDFFLLLGSPKR